MNQPLFLLESGFLGRNQNTLVFENINGKRYFPIMSYDSIYLIGEVSLNSKLLTYLSRKQIPVFFFGFTGNFSGVFYPWKKRNFSGKFVIKQANAYSNTQKRGKIASQIVGASIHNIRKTLLQYKLNKEADSIQKFKEMLEETGNIGDILSLEANARKRYYSSFNFIIKDKYFSFVKRVYNPPNDAINAMISFGNALLYSSLLAEMYKTKLDPRISFVHEPSDNRFSLCLDLADIFKPIIVDRVIFYLINNRMISQKHFQGTKEGFYLNKRGKEIFIRRYNQKLNDSLKLRNKDRMVSYKYLLRQECFSLIDYIEGTSKRYKGFRMWW
jgi:CRISPR-associated protein Cas1